MSTSPIPSLNIDADPRFARVIAFFTQLTGKEADLNGRLFLLGVNVLGQGTRPFSKEEKQDLMHIGICTILAHKGHWQLTHTDADGWPHYELGTPMPMLPLEDQEVYLENALADYLEAEGLI
jgi:hypothetical protein